MHARSVSPGGLLSLAVSLYWFPPSRPGYLMAVWLTRFYHGIPVPLRTILSVHWRIYVLVKGGGVWPRVPACRRHVLLGRGSGVMLPRKFFLNIGAFFCIQLHLLTNFRDSEKAIFCTHVRILLNYRAMAMPIMSESYRIDRQNSLPHGIRLRVGLDDGFCPKRLGVAVAHSHHCEPSQPFLSHGAPQVGLYAPKGMQKSSSLPHINQWER